MARKAVAPHRSKAFARRNSPIVAAYFVLDAIREASIFSPTCAKRGKRGIGCLCVRQVCLYEKVDVLRKAGLRVKNDSVTANNQIPNAMGMEGGQKVFVVLVHPVLSPNL
jgi:hypothetical protein